MNRRSFLSLTAASVAALSLKAKEPDVAKITNQWSDEEFSRFDDACTARRFLKEFYNPDDYKWVKAGMRPPCEPIKYDIDPRSRAFSFMSKDWEFSGRHGPPPTRRFIPLKDCQPTMMDFRHDRATGCSYVSVPWIEIWGQSAKKVYLAKQKMLVDLLEHAATASFSRKLDSDGEPWWKTEVFRYHVASADHRLKGMGFPNIRQILVKGNVVRGLTHDPSHICNMIVEALEVIHLTSNSVVGVMASEACPENTMYITADREHLGAFEQCSYVVDGKFISHVNMAILSDYAVTKIEF